MSLTDSRSRPSAPPPARSNSSNALNQARRQPSDQNTSTQTSLSPDDSSDNNTAVNELMEAIDSFCMDVEKKYKAAGEEIMAKCECLPSQSIWSVDEMAARCDRIEAELLLNSQVEDEDGNEKAINGDKS
ncbi:MAG: hypothetical protein Q9227_009439 [Pyrenula ochraceoflavens]